MLYLAESVLVSNMYFPACLLIYLWLHDRFRRKKAMKNRLLHVLFIVLLSYHGSGMQ